MAPGATDGGEGGGELHQRPGKDIGDQQVERGAGLDHRVVHAVGDRQQQFSFAMAQRNGVDRGIVAGHVDADRVDVGRDALRPGPQRQCGEGEQPGAGADVGDVGESLARLLETVERGEAARRGGMLSGAEGKAGVDFETGCTVGPILVVHRGVNEEPAGADRFEPGLAQRHPVGRILEPFEHGIAVDRERFEDAHFLPAGLAVEISVDAPIVRLGLVGFLGDDDRRVEMIGEQQVAVRDRLRFGLGAVERDAPAHCEFSLARRASRAADCRAA